MKVVGPIFNAHQAHLPSPPKGAYRVSIEFSASGLEYTGTPLINPEGTESHAIFHLSLDRDPTKNHPATRIKTCTIDKIGISPHNDLTRMTTLAALLERTVRLCSRNKVKHLAFPISTSNLRAQWLACSLHVAGFRPCNCLQLPPTFRGTCLCLDLAIPDHSPRSGVESPEIIQQLAPPSVCVDNSTLNADEKSEFLTAFTSRTTPILAAKQQVQAQPDTMISKTLLLPAPNQLIRPHPNTNTTTLHPIPNPASPQHLSTDKKEYCTHWIRTGECNYMQQGCKYKHEIPLDPETLRKIGVRHVPKWLLEGNKDGLEKLLAVKMDSTDMTVIGDGTADRDVDNGEDERVKAWLGRGKVVEEKVSYRPTHGWKRRYGGKSYDCMVRG